MIVWLDHLVFTWLPRLGSPKAFFGAETSMSSIDVSSPKIDRQVPWPKVKYRGHHISMSTLHRSTHWIDLVNDELKRLNSTRFLTSECEEYPKALKAVRIYYLTFPVSFVRHPGRLPGRTYWVRNDYQRAFIEHFSSRFNLARFARGIKASPPHSEAYNLDGRTIKRKNHLRDSDICLDEHFFRKYLPNWVNLTHKERQYFEERKDVYHEDIYGNISRLDNCNQDFISGDKQMKRRFVMLLNNEIDKIISRRHEEKTRYQRHFQETKPVQ